MRYLIFLLLFLIAGCATNQPAPVEKEKEPSIKDMVAKLEHSPIDPNTIPDGFTHDVKKYTDPNGKVWVLVDPDDLNKIRQAYLSAEGNADLVKRLNEINRLTVDKANLIRELAILEEYQTKRMKLRLDEEREYGELREKQLQQDVLWWKIATILGLAVGL